MNKNQSVWQGKINLTYQKKSDRTELISAYHQSPFKIQKPFYPEEDQTCHTVIVHTAGGIVGGDLLTQNINLQANSQTLITTPAANKIYKTNGKTAQQNIKIKLEKNSYLEYLPQENIIFTGAEYQQNLQVELAENAHFCTWEISRFGRTARGEKFTQGDWKSSTEIWQNQQPLWIDKQWLQGSEITVNSLNALAGFAIVGSFCWLGKEIKPELIQKMRDLAEKEVKQGQTGVTQIMQGVLCRYRGNSTTEVKRWFMNVWNLLRSYYLNKKEIIPRVWQI